MKATGRTTSDRFARMHNVINLNECEKYEESLNYIENDLQDLKEVEAIIQQQCFTLWGMEKYDEFIAKVNEKK